MRAETIVTEEEQAAVARQIERYAADLRPECPIEADLTRWAAVSAARKRRCEDAEQAALRPLAAAAVRKWEERRRKAIRRRAQDLARDPAGVLDDLLGSGFGCDWLIGRWMRLDRPLSLGLGWGADDLQDALLLLGQDPESPDDPLAAEVRRLALDINAPDASRGRLRALIAAEVDRLEQIGSEAEQAVDAPEREAVRLAALVDTSKDGQLRRRYDRDAELSTHRNINLLLRLRRDEARLEYRAQQLAGVALIPRSPVGDGWWREPHASPAPPGFIPIAEAPEAVLIPVVNTEQGPTMSAPTPSTPAVTSPPRCSDPSRPRPDEPSEADVPAQSPDVPASDPHPPAPNEANSTRPNPDADRPNRRTMNDLSPGRPPRHPEGVQRTVPRPLRPSPPGSRDRIPDARSRAARLHTPAGDPARPIGDPRRARE